MIQIGQLNDKPRLTGSFEWTLYLDVGAQQSGPLQKPGSKPRSKRVGSGERAIRGKMETRRFGSKKPFSGIYGQVHTKLPRRLALIIVHLVMEHLDDT